MKLNRCVVISRSGVQLVRKIAKVSHTLIDAYVSDPFLTSLTPAHANVRRCRVRFLFSVHCVFGMGAPSQICYRVIALQPRDVIHAGLRLGIVEKRQSDKPMNIVIIGAFSFRKITKK